MTRGYVAIVDDEDFDRVSAFNWQVAVRKVGGKLTPMYAQRACRSSENKKSVQLMHVFLTGHSGVDHFDGNGFNNRRDNLRHANQAQNSANSKKRVFKSSSLWKGVSWDAAALKWRASITKDGHAHNLGRFKLECNAAQAYNFAAAEMFGEFARFNTPEGCL